MAILPQNPAARAAVEPALTELGLRTVEWAAGVEARAVLIVLERGELTSRQAFEIGVAVGAFGADAIVVQLGAGRLPEELADRGSIRIEPGRQSSQALRERLRRAGL